ncbi:ketol-acid reductoisomerase [Buchnera aphidicola (Taiwanaphis decaspermi)]|uniref:ketol-acid reductoisomerase n=1 Tax=Buchnera aphidicola TaxID=9 RepID=UPI0031B81D3D
MSNYFNKLNFRKKISQLKKCRFVLKKEFLQSKNFLINKKIVIVGCGSQGLNQGLNMRDSGLNVSYALRKKSILKKTNSYKNAIKNKFVVNTYKKLIPTADLVINLTPDKQHSIVIKKIQPLMKKYSILGYSHGFNIVEMGEVIRSDITVIMVAPKCPGSEVREEYKRGFGVPALIAVHPENNINKNGIEIAKSWAMAIGSDKAGVLESSFVAEVKSDLMGEQTILCGLLQAGSLFCYDFLVSQNFDKCYSASFIQYGWEIITESLKHGGIKLMLNRLSPYAKYRVHQISEIIKKNMKYLFQKHMDNIISGDFSKKMIQDWKNNDIKLLKWRKEIKNTDFEKSKNYTGSIFKEDFFKKGVLMISIVKAGIELAFETMLSTGIMPESAYYESLHELPLIANTIARKRLHEMNVIISDTAEYGSYLFTKPALKIFKKILHKLNKNDIGNEIKSYYIDNKKLLKLQNFIDNHKIEKVGLKLRKYMTKMKNI